MDIPKVKKKFLEMAKEKTELNRHDDHLASCLCCRHLSVIDAEPHYSEYTPGSSAKIDCSEGVVDFDEYFFARSFRLMHNWGPHCPLFAHKPEADNDGLEEL